MQVQLASIAYARSGDKGDNCNIGVAARDPGNYRILREQVTADAVKAHFDDICRGTVHRYELPNLHALNFVLESVLDGGGAKSLRLDPQGKTLCDALMLMTVEVPDELGRRLSK